MSSPRLAARFQGSVVRSFAAFLDFLRLHSWVALVVFSLGPALVLRAYLIGVYPPGSLWPSWLLAATRGTVSDAAFSLTLSLVLYRLFSGKVSGSLAVGVLLSLLYAGNHEHVYYNYAHLNVAMAPIGLTGEVLLGNFLIAPVLAKAAVAFALSLAAMFGLFLIARRTGGKRRERARAKRGRRAGRSGRQGRKSRRPSNGGKPQAAPTTGHARWPWLLAGTLVVLTAALPVGLKHPGFVQTSLHEANVRRLVDALRAPPPQEIGPRTAEDSTVDWERFHPRDLTGSPALSFSTRSREPDQRPNILLVLLEGWDRNVMDAGFTPELESLAGTNVYLPNVFAHQVQTHRGLYSILCGDYPNLLQPDAKADIVGEFGTTRPCLPEILADRGYETVFMQSADLHFMRKDRFAPAIGFGEVHGSESFANAPRSAWGVDDGTLMRGAVERIARLSEGPAPWMMTLLTSGTHPPYFVPGDSPDRPGADAREQAFRFSDKVTGELIEKLRRDGLLENTWVFVLSDEASTKFNRDVTGDYVGFLSGGFHRTGVLVITPDRQSARLPGVFGLKDIMISVLDLLGLADTVPAARGRSLFRAYEHPAPIVYSSIYEEVFLVRENTAVHLCTMNLNACSSVRRDDPPGRPVALDVDTDLVARAHLFARANDFGYQDVGPIGTVFEERTTLYREPRRRVIGNRQVGVKAGQRLVWRVLLSAPANNRESSRASLLIKVTGAEQFTKTWTIAPGESVSFVEDRSFDRNVVVTTELFVRSRNEDGLFVREVSLKKQPASPDTS